LPAFFFFAQLSLDVLTLKLAVKTHACAFYLKTALGSVNGIPLASAINFLTFLSTSQVFLPFISIFFSQIPLNLKKLSYHCTLKRNHNYKLKSIIRSWKNGYWQ
jgi:hypothetical protein